MTSTSVRILAPTLLVAALALAACSGAGGDDDSGSSAGGDTSAAAPEPATEDLGSADDGAGDGASDSDGVASTTLTGRDKAAVAPDELTEQPRSLIRQGNVALRADDVGRAQIEVQKVVDRYAGQVSDEKTQSDDDGEPAYTRMVLRIPSDDFDEAVGELKKIGELESADTQQEDVTTQVIDVQTRLQVQKRSIARITVLFQQAKGIRDVMAIEAELSQRQADLEALEQQAAYLADQTSMSTLTVSIDQIPAKRKATPKEDDATGFAAGLSAGWGSLSTFAVALATVAGAVLPWLVVAAIVAVPVLLLLRSRRVSRAGRPGRTQSTA